MALCMWCLSRVSTRRNSFTLKESGSLLLYWQGDAKILQVSVHKQTFHALLLGGLNFETVVAAI